MTVPLDVAAYRRSFADPQCGVTMARAIARRHGLDPGSLQRLVEGSNLLFRCTPRLWLKIAPPFWRASLDVEARLLPIVHGQLGVETPRPVLQGTWEDSAYLLTTHVHGVAWRQVRSALDRATRIRLAATLGRVCRRLHALRPRVEGSGEERLPVERPWEAVAERQRARGAPDSLVAAIVAYLQRHQALLTEGALVPVVHADLTDEHVLVRRGRSGWRLGGLLDFADATSDRREAEFVLPFLQLLPEDARAQRAFLDGYGYPPARWSTLPRLLMGLLLAHRFCAVHEWLAPWLRDPGWTFESVAERIFPVPSPRGPADPRCE